MGAWSGEPFGNDTAADWAWELDAQDDWQVVHDALNDAVTSTEYIDAEVATNAIAAAEVVAQGLGRATQDDGYTESVALFVARASKPTEKIVELAVAALAAASGPNSELTDLWAESDGAEWSEANTRLKEALDSSHL